MTDTKFDGFVRNHRPADTDVPWTKVEDIFRQHKFTIRPQQRRLARWLGFKCRMHVVSLDGDHDLLYGAWFYLARDLTLPVVYGTEIGWYDNWGANMYPGSHVEYRPYIQSGGKSWNRSVNPGAHIPGTTTMIPLNNAIREVAPIVRVELPEKVLRVPLYGNTYQSVCAFASEVPELLNKQLQYEDGLLRKKEQEIAETRSKLASYARSVRYL